jgi:mycofactocin precursor
MDDTFVTAVDTVDDSVEDYTEDDLLVEEISIDGMCGVY